MTNPPYATPGAAAVPAQLLRRAAPGGSSAPVAWGDTEPALGAETGGAAAQHGEDSVPWEGTDIWGTDR